MILYTKMSTNRNFLLQYRAEFPIEFTLSVSYIVSKFYRKFCPQ